MKEKAKVWQLSDAKAAILPYSNGTWKQSINKKTTK